MSVIKMKKVYSLFFVILFSCSNVYSQMTYPEVRETVLQNKKETEELKSELVLQKERFENNKQNYQTLYDGLGNQIAIASFMLIVIAAALSYFITYYIKKKQEEIQELADTAKKAVEATIEVTELLEKSTDSINKTKLYIDDHNKELYGKIKRDFNLSYINRVVNVPEDLENLLPVMFTMEFLPEDFTKFKSIVKNNNAKDYNVSNNAMVLLAQHFPFELISDLDLRKELLTEIKRKEMSCMFKIDVFNFLDAFSKYLKNEEMDISQKKELIVHIFYELFYSSAKKYFKKDQEEEFNYLRDLTKGSNISNNELLFILKENKDTELEYINWIEELFKET